MIRRAWQELKRGEPGRRFQERHERRGHAGIRKYAMLAAGLLILLAGIVFLPLPGPGMLIVALGALMLAEGSRAVARGLDSLELFIRSSLRRSGSR